MESGLIRLRTYRQVWRLERVIYQIERVLVPIGRLPGVRSLPGCAPILPAAAGSERLPWSFATCTLSRTW